VVVTSSRTFEDVRKSLGSNVRVLACGSGTVEDSTAMWFEVIRKGHAQEPALSLFDFRVALTPFDCIRSVQPVTEGGGKDLSQQIPLLSSFTGNWRGGGVSGGAQAPEPVAGSPKVLVEQMPLFGEKT
jgi:hypothetical protein